MNWLCKCAGTVLVLFVLTVVTIEAQQQEHVPLIKYGVSRTIKTVNYRANTSTRIDFVGTALEPRARGTAKIGSTPGRTLIEAEVQGLFLATKFGPEYLTYVLWAVTPEGRATNLGQFVVRGSKTKLNVTTRLQTFGLIVTAEPYFAVTYPSDVVVLENVPRPDTKGGVDVVEAKYELLQRGQYRVTNVQPFVFDLKTPMDLYEARNAKRIAQREGADRYAPDSWAKAETALNRAEDYLKRKQKKAIPTAAREATQSFEDARIITIRRKIEERLAQEKQEAAERVAQAKAEEARARSEAEAAARSRQEEEAARLRAERQKVEAEAGQQAALAKEREAAERAQRAEREKQELRARLLKQFNRVLPTRDTERGLVVNMGDVLFDVGKSNLRPAAREALAKLSGIMLNYPALQLSIEGHTDSTGSAEFNQRLSEQRAEAVRTYLVEQGLSTNSTAARGFGETMPAADNSTPEGRQMNRRVEIIVSGEVIGMRIGETP
jgi:outer membrane protein OmpA-like peptidoglycan-associated protein